MSLIVQKFGGSSLADTGKIKSAAAKSLAEVRAGHKLIVAVSAMGKTTDGLIGLAQEIAERPPLRELDMLLATGEQVSAALFAMAICEQGGNAVSFNGAQVGIYTDGHHTRARIKNISTDRISRALEAGQVVVVTGFQGVREDLTLTTLGRGASDTTAVALAAVMGADRCDIYTDVDGVHTTDPRIVPEARRIDRISYDEMLELASMGAKVMHSRSIEFIKKYRIPVRVRSSFEPGEGTIITEEAPEMEDVVVSGIALNTDEAKITIRNVADQPGVAAKIFGAIAEAQINIDVIIQNVSDQGQTDISFTVLRTDLAEARDVVRTLVDDGVVETFTEDQKVAKLSVVGVGMRSHTGVASKLFRALAQAGVNIRMISTSEIKISVVFAEDMAEEALRAVHAAFELDRAPADRSAFPPA